MIDVTCEASGGRLCAAMVASREEAIVYFDDTPVLLVRFGGRWSCDHVIVYAEREMPITGDCLDAITFANELTLTGFLDRVWAALNEHDNNLLR